MLAPIIEPTSLLRVLGLDADEHLIGSVRAGLAAADLCDDNHPPNYRGMVAYAEGVHALRLRTAPLGWRRSNEAGLGLTISPDGRTAIMFGRGNALTGVAGEQNPQLANPKGEASRYVIRRAQRDFFLSDEEKPAPTIYILLWRVDDGKLYAELSKVLRLASDGLVATWGERCLLPTTALEGDVEVARTSGSEASDGAMPVEIAVTRKK